MSLVWKGPESRFDVSLGIFVNPILFFVGHSTTARDLARRSRFVDRAGTWTVAERLGSVAALARIPVVDDHLDGHLAAPDAARAFVCVRSHRKAPMAALSVDAQLRWDTVPWGRLWLFIA